jgi:uncharacterized protein with FMN-binding domain
MVLIEKEMNMYNQHQSHKSSGAGRAFRKFFLSAFVVSSFAVYAIHKSLTGSDVAANFPAPGTDTSNAQVFSPTVIVPNNGTSRPGSGITPLQQRVAPTATAVPPVAAVPAPSTGGLYKDGTYTGPQVNAFYGMVQVQTVIQNGKIQSVQFLQFPQDRRTSARINSTAVPRLQQEAIQAQSANVNIVTGATLTSQAFIRSLNSALSKATGGA